jgi:hypothetical protein
MANISQYMTKAMLDWALLGATPTRPVGIFVGLSLAAPTSVASSEVATGSGYARQGSATSVFAAAGTPSGSGTATNTLAMTFGPFSSSAVISGVFISDTVSSNAGNGLFYGNLATVRTPLTGDSLVFASGALTVTLN